MQTPPAVSRFVRTLVATGSCAALLSSGCATFADGRYQRVQVETNPPAARVSVNGRQGQTKAVPLQLQFETPGEVILLRKEKHVVLRIEKEGYEPAEVALARRGSQWAPIGGASWMGLGVLTGWIGGAAVALTMGGVFLGISVGVDLATGSAYQLNPSKMSLTLQPLPASGEAAVLRQGGER